VWSFHTITWVARILSLTLNEACGNIQDAYKLSDYFAKHDGRCILCNEIVHTTFVSTSQDKHDIQTAVGTHVEPPQNSRTHQLRSVGETAISFQRWFTLFARDGSSGYRTIPNVMFTVCNLHEFHEIATLPTQVMA
jgi:hypothetical protein